MREETIFSLGRNWALASYGATKRVKRGKIVVAGSDRELGVEVSCLWVLDEVGTLTVALLGVERGGDDGTDGRLAVAEALMAILQLLPPL